MSKKPSKQVDLVIYKGGERIVIGRASVDPDGTIQAQIARDVREDVKELIYGNTLDNLSLNPKVPVSLKYTSPFYDRKTMEPIETAVVPPLMIQE